MAFTPITYAAAAAFDCAKNKMVVGASTAAIALDETNGNTIPYHSKQCIVITNTSGSNTCTITITSAPDSSGRVGTQTETIAANGWCVIPPLDALYNDDGVVNLTLSGTGTLVAYLVRPVD